LSTGRGEIGAPEANTKADLTAHDRNRSQARDERTESPSVTPDTLTSTARDSVSDALSPVDTITPATRVTMTERSSHVDRPSRRLHWLRMRQASFAGKRRAGLGGCHPERPEALFKMR
jgi:hypothetical protein